MSDTMETQVMERRKVRSSQPGRALGFLFESVAVSHPVAHVALADSRGLLLVHRGDPEICDVLAAYGPLLSRTIDPVTRARIIDALLAAVPTATPERLSFRRFESGGETLYLCVIGAPGAAKDVALGRALSGARRILA